MAKKIIKGTSLLLLAFIIFSAALTGTYGIIIPSSLSVSASSALPSYPLASAFNNTDNAFSASCSSVDYKLYGVIPLKSVEVSKYKDLRLYPGGMPFGVKFITEGVLVVGFCEVTSADGTKNPAYDSGIRVNDVITKVNDQPIMSADELTQTVENGKGKSVTLTYMRDGKEHTAKLTPAYSKNEAKYKSGIYVRDSGAGIGTVTFIVPGTYAFGGLGHGICDAQSGKLIPMQRGSVVDVTINGVVKGLAGSPGEVKGYFNSGKTGTLLDNTDCGVYGLFAQKPDSIHTEPIPICLRNELTDGKAYIYCTLSENKTDKYEVEISNIQRDATGNKCFTVKVTDKRLLDISGGIVQGMSGSPIIQNGKLVGAVTHVLINDPTTGYGIFIENMLSAVQMPMAKAS